MAKPPDKEIRGKGGKSKRQLRDADTGRFITQDSARKKPGKVEWEKKK
jgi:hypothetical protein